MPVVDSLIQLAHFYPYFYRQPAMTSLERGWANGGTIPLFHEQGNNFGGMPFTSSAVSGPVFDAFGKQLRAMNPAEGFAEFFGTPKKKLERPAADDLEQELYDLPAAYKGKNSYISQILISQITSDDTWILRDFAPWTRHEDSLQVAWDVWSFNDHLLGRTPEEAVSRLLTSKVSAESTTMVRYGIALMLEHGFFNSPKGRKHYAMNIKQIQNAIVETAALGAMTAALNADVWVDGYDIYRENSRGRNKSALDAFFANELDTFAMLQKSEDGFVNMISMMEESLGQRNGVNPNMVCLPKGTKKYMQNITMGKPYAESGLKIGERKDLISSGLAGTGLRYYESRYFRMAEHRAAFDPAYRERTIGTFFQSNSSVLRNVDPQDFRISMLDTILYNEDSDGMDLFSYRENVRYYGLFNNFDNSEFASLSLLGKKYFAGHHSWWDYMNSTSPHEALYSVRGIASKSPEVQAKFVHAMLGNNNGAPVQQQPQPSSFSITNPFGTTSSSSSRHPATSGRFTGSGVSGRKEQEEHKHTSTISVSALSQSLQREFKLGNREARQLEHFLSHIQELDVRGRDVCNLLDKVQTIVNRKRSVLNATNLQATLEFELAADLLCFDLNRAVMDIRGGALDLSPTALEQTFDGVWPMKATSAMQAAETQSPYWQQLHNTKARLPISVYHSPNQAQPLPLHSQVFTLTSSSIALLRLSPKVLAELTQQAGIINIDFSHSSGGTISHSDLTRAGLLQYSVAISAAFEILKAALPLYKAAADAASRQRVLAEALANVQHAVATHHPISADEDFYQHCIEIARGLPILECQQSLASIIATLSTIVRARSSGQLDQDMFASAAHAFWQQYNVFHSIDNPSRSGQAGTSGIMRPRGVTSNAASFVLSNAGHSFDSFYEEALSRTANLHKKMITDKRVGIDNDSFTVFQDSYIEMYQVVKAKGWDLKKVWLKLVEHCQSEFIKPQGLDTVAAILNSIFAYFSDATTEPDVDAITADTEVTKQKADHAARLQQLTSDFQTSLAFHRKHHAELYESEPYIQTTARAERKKALVDKNIDLTNPLDKFVSQLYHAAKDLPTALFYIDQVAGKLRDEFKSDVRPYALLEYLCLKHSAVEVDRLLRGSQDELAKEVITRLLRNGSVNEHWKQIQLKWGQNTDPSAKVAANKGDYANDKRQLQKLSEHEIIALLKTPGINGGYMRFCVDNDVLPPLGHVGHRPHATYEMGTAWMAEGGGKCASTLFGHADFQLGDDPARKIHYGHFTMYNKTVIYSKQHIVHARDVFCRDYKGGNGTTVWDPLNPDDVDAYITNNLKYDIFLIPTPIGRYTSAKHQSITGNYPKELQATKEVTEATQIYRMEIWVKHWRWMNQEKRDPLTPSIYQDAKHNIIVFQCHQGVYNSVTKFPDRIITEKGHWGPNVYATCGKTRKGGQTHKTLLHVNHNGVTNTIQLVKN